MINSLVKPIRRKFRHHKKWLIPWAEKWRWVLVAGVGFLLFLIEVYEFIEFKLLNQPLHMGEIISYGILIVSTGLFLELFVRLNRDYKHMLKILAYKHNLSLEFALNDSWETFSTKLVELPHRITEVDEAHLLIGNPVTDKFEVSNCWKNGNSDPGEEIWDPSVLCHVCFEKASTRKTNFHRCNIANDSSIHVYSLGMFHPKMAPAMLKFKLKAGSALSDDEENLFKNIGDEIAVALRVSQDHKKIAELQQAEATMAERRAISAYVHDELGQNLGYLHFKLGQLTSNHDHSPSTDLHTEIRHLEEVANESYEIVRDILKRLQPDTTPHLTNLLKEHANIVSRRAKFALDFSCTGNPSTLMPDVQKAIFYIFRETLNNIERHARADKVAVLVVWGENSLDISVTDNGIGFDQNSVNFDDHFGMEIMRGRISDLHGQIAVTSSADAGTAVALSIPVFGSNGT